MQSHNTVMRIRLLCNGRTQVRLLRPKRRMLGPIGIRLLLSTCATSLCAFACLLLPALLTLSTGSPGKQLQQQALQLLEALGSAETWLWVHPGCVRMSVHSFIHACMHPFCLDIPVYCKRSQALNS